MAAPTLSPQAILALLAAAPPRIAELTAGLSEAQLRTPPGREEWSAGDLLAHLRACGDVWGGCILTILTEEQPVFRRLSPRAHMKKTNYADLPFSPSFRAYVDQRAELLALLEPLPGAAWARTAQVKESGGRQRERSLHFYAQTLAQHEAGHLPQIERLVAGLRG